MTVEVGSKTEGKVTGITNFGAFVDLGDKQSGMVHISEVADSYVKDIHDVLKVGDTVKVLVLNDKDGKIALSIKQATDKPRPRHHERKPRPQQHQQRPESFDDMMSGFMKESEDRLSTLRKNTEGKRGGRGGRRG
ncbi:S1 domain-containing RNA-binding protein [Companilactobacillus mishanensis]|uniref:RNA-binding protein S1 n=1 Tax=Companilactobacillus mishanensis TaxID=2486008 RepID=A0ABW9P7K1_9LACO|nr:S1 domain-containing RNA-binding protein [Companilactobacillus mishanensis]MQS44932.1 RNA-binding protein S1 [Companilactobacillus mishanensis]MQS89447.1 RNA-binding protein S1 [Companilactobacillus mishanensis]